MSKKENIEHEIRITISAVKVVSFVLSEINDDNLNDELVFNTRMQLDLNSNLKILKILVVVTATTLEGREMFSEIKVENIYEYDSSEKLHQDKDGFEFPRFVLDRLVENSISNVRGILVEKFKGTKFQNQIIPLMDFSNFEKE